MAHLASRASWKWASVVLLLFAPVFVSTPQSLQTSLQRSWHGSGVIISPDGYLLTNNHVVKGATVLTVETPDGKRFTARVVAVLAEQDIALLKIDGKGLPFIPLELNRSVEVGEPVVSIGSPEGLIGTVSVGIITGLNRNVESLGLKGLLQTNAGIAPGSSGGPLIDTRGRVIGINVCVKASGSERIPLTEFGFAIPIKSIASWILSNVPTLPKATVGPAEPELTVREIAARCSPATVYITGTVEVALQALLPTKIAGYSLSSPSSWKKPVGESPPPNPILPLPVVPPPPLPRLFSGPDCGEFNMPGSWLSSPGSRLGGDPLEWTNMDGSRDLGDIGKFSVNVLLAMYSSPSEARSAAQQLVDVDLKGMQLLSRDGVKVQGIPMDTAVALAFGEGRKPCVCWRGLNSPSANYALAFTDLLTEEGCASLVGAVLRATSALAVGELVFAVSLAWEYTWSGECVCFRTVHSLPSRYTSTEAKYSYSGSCVSLWRRTTETNRYWDTKTRWWKEETKVLGEMTTKLMCLDTFVAELQLVVASALSALLAGLGN